MSSKNSCLTVKHVQVLLRIPKDLLDRLDQVAKASYRSRTSEVNLRLELSLANESVNEHGVIVVQAPSSLK